MFGFGKQKMSIESFCNDQFIKVTSAERVSIWRAYIDQSDDVELKKVDFERFCNYMIACYVQLLRVAAIKTQNSDNAMYFGICLTRKLEDKNAGAYKEWVLVNRIWGAPSVVGKIEEMAMGLGIHLYNTGLSDNTKQTIHQELEGLMYSMSDVMKRIKLQE